MNEPILSGGGAAAVIFVIFKVVEVLIQRRNAITQAQTKNREVDATVEVRMIGEAQEMRQQLRERVTELESKVEAQSATIIQLHEQIITERLECERKILDLTNQVFQLSRRVDGVQGGGL